MPNTIKYIYTDDQIALAVKESLSIAEVMRKLGIRYAGGSYCNLKRRILKAGIDTAHFLGKGWNRNRAPKNKRHWTGILIDRSQSGYRREHAAPLRRALLDYGRDHKCALCMNGGTWNGKKLILEIDHIDRNWLDDRPENLRFLCPNCHSQN